MIKTVFLALIIYIHFIYIKMYKNSSAKYYQKNKEILQQQIIRDIKFFLKKRKKKQEYGPEQYKNLSEDEKQRLVEYRKSYFEMQTNKTASQIKTY